MADPRKSDHISKMVDAVTRAVNLANELRGLWGEFQILHATNPFTSEDFEGANAHLTVGEVIAAYAVLDAQFEQYLNVPENEGELPRIAKLIMVKR